MSDASGMDGDPLYIDPAERVWAGMVEHLFDDPLTRFQEANTIKIAMQDMVDEFRTWAADMRERAGREPAGLTSAQMAHIQHYGQRETTYDGDDDVRIPREIGSLSPWAQVLTRSELMREREDADEMVSQRFAAKALTQSAPAQRSWREAWRQRWNVNADQRSARRRAHSRETQPEQEQGHGQGYGR